MLERERAPTRRYRRGTRGQVDRRDAGDDVDALIFACVRREASDAKHAI
jgi:hypothetical protein